MKHATSVLFIAFVLLAFAGAALAAEMSGEVTAVDTAKGTLTLKSGTVAAAFDCETRSLIKDVKVGDKVTVQYKENGGKKITTKVSPMKKVAPSGC
jgi:opacity protein-like surface antigen